ncbi:MAG: VWA domain-containing protein, partial [Saprospiraceae bacterium]
MRKILFPFLRRCIGLLLFSLLVTSLFGGSGTITPAPSNTAGIRGLMNFTVNFRYVPTAADVTAMENAIRVANDAICDATDGQIVFGTVTITSGAVNEEQADIWVLPDPGRSGVSFWTDGSGFGREGAHINLFSSGIDGRVIAHELGHLAFGIGDEYDEQCRWGGPCGIGPAFDAANINDRNNTIMANHNTMSELSVAGNHDPLRGDGSGCPSTATCMGTGTCTGDACNGFNGTTNRYEASQNTLLNGGLSDWEVLRRNYMGLGITIPTLPVAAVPTTCGSFLNIVRQVQGSSLVVLVLDRSGSMSIRDVGDRTRMEFAQAASRAFVDLQQSKNINLGIVAFSTNAATVRSVQDLTTANANAFKTDIDALTPNGSTAIGDGLIEGRVQLQIAQAIAAANGETL